MTILHIFLRIQFVLNKEELCDSSGLQGLSLFYDMQGGRSSSLLGSIDWIPIHGKGSQRLVWATFLWKTTKYHFLRQMETSCCPTQPWAALNRRYCCAPRLVVCFYSGRDRINVWPPAGGAVTAWGFDAPDFCWDEFSTPNGWCKQLEDHFFVWCGFVQLSDDG